MIAEGLAALLDGLGLGTWDVAREYPPDALWPITLDALPSRPDRAIALTVYPGPESSMALGYDEPNVQLRVRGGPDPTVSRDRAAALYAALHGLRSTALPGGLWLVSSIALQSGPIPLGRDETGRHEHSVNVRTEYRNPTPHRQ